MKTTVDSGHPTSKVSGNREKNVTLDHVELHGESYFKMGNQDAMPPFFMSIVSDSNHWMFISSNGGLSAGRKDANGALFPYYTDDVLTKSAETTGSKTIIRYTNQGETYLWEPFSDRNSFNQSYTRNLYKSALGDKVLFEEVNHDLNLTYRYSWSTSGRYGFVRESQLINHSGNHVSVELLDGIQNVMPYGVSADLQGIRSNLAEAYKRSELDAESRLGIFALSAIIIDRAEPSEALKANTVWSLGLDGATVLLSSLQLDVFRRGSQLVQEEDIKATNGSYLLSKKVVLSDGQSENWMIIADVNQGPSDVSAKIADILSNDKLEQLVKEDVISGSVELTKLVASSDGFQLGADAKRNVRHYSNTLFNIMRGGIFDQNYQIEKKDFEHYLHNANKKTYADHKSILNGLSEVFTHQDLKKVAQEQGDESFTRLAIEYLPLKFSRRHGDPSRPWNQFSINMVDEKDGSKILDYEGNWRDIFQNWEALAHSYPEFIESMIFKFLNATTADGYNPYRVTKDGFDWEVIEPHDPWSYIGYWGDHQIIYLLKFLEFAEDYYPGQLSDYLSKELFVYANVPYRIKQYQDILSDPKDTILFDEKRDQEIRIRRGELGGDGAFLQEKNGRIYRANLLEKLLVTSLTKLSNFIPEAGIWMNTQRPEWNDANNALVGHGVSMVTLCYLRRFFTFFQRLTESGKEEITVNESLYLWFEETRDSLTSNQSLLSDRISDSDRRHLLDSLGNAGSAYRETVYDTGLSDVKKPVSLLEVKEFSELVIKYLDHSIKNNKRHDGMYHSYNLMTVSGDSEVTIEHLSEMLEGQVAVLSSGLLTSEQSLELLDSLKASALFRNDQYSYLLYPNKELPGFFERNIIPKKSVESSRLLGQLLADSNKAIIEQDINGVYHFNGSFNNADSLLKALNELPEAYHENLSSDRELVLDIFEQVFNHKAFTGRSGTFYGYEGLGSIYWHMVSKLLLAVEEVCLTAISEKSTPEVIVRLIEHYYEINEGLGVHKSPELYGAFPTDPYSHTPMNKGAQQPGMTGQVKEDILSRKGELGAFVSEGKLTFQPELLRKNEFLQDSAQFKYADVSQELNTIELEKGEMGFSYCQVPVIYRLANQEQIEVVLANGENKTFDGLQLDKELSSHIFNRSGHVIRIHAMINPNRLK